MSCWALVPVKERAACKTRLAAVLSSQARVRLVHALLDHVIDTLRHAAAIDHIAIVSPDGEYRRSDVTLIARERMGLNEDLSFALSRITEAGATRAVIVPADLPLLATADVDELSAAATPGGIAIAPDSRGRGTNALALGLPTHLALAFGNGSFLQHLAQCRDQGLAARVIRREGFSFDVDETDDLHRLRRYPRWSRFTAQLDRATPAHALPPVAG